VAVLDPARNLRPPHALLPVVALRGQDEVRRAVEAKAVKERMEAETYARKLREKPFYRFRRRQALGKAIARARAREKAALRLLDDAR
jgi:hypothetical protein